MEEETMVVDDVTFEIEELKNEIFKIKQQNENLRMFIKSVAYDSLTSLQVLKAVLLKMLPGRWLRKSYDIDTQFVKLGKIKGYHVLRYYI